MRLAHGAAVKIAISIPRYGDTKGDFTISLARMIVHTMKAGQTGGTKLDLEVFSASSSDLPENRTNLLKRAMGWQARYLLWLDADHVFPPDALLRLMAHRLPVVGCNYARRAEPIGPVAARFNEDGGWEHVWTTAELARRRAVEEVAHVGLGLCLMDMTLFREVQAHVDRGVGWAQWSPFDRRLVPGTTSRMGEDASFFAELRDAGVKIFVDHALSWQVGHIGERILTNADTEAHRLASLKGGGDSVP